MGIHTMTRYLYEVHFFGFFAHPKYKTEWEDFKTRASKYCQANFEFHPAKDLYYKCGNPFVMVYKVELNSRGEKVLSSRKIVRQINIRERRIVKCLASWLENNENI